MNYFQLLQHRKSVRKFTEEKLSHHDLDKLLLAANAAPIGSNLYKDLHLTVVEDRAVLDKLSEAASRRWHDKHAMESIWGGAYQPKEELSQKTYDPFHGAPTVIFISHRKQNVQPGIQYANVACVAHSVHLASVELELGSVFIWFALESMHVFPELDHTDLLQLPPQFEPLLGIAVGHPASPLPQRELQNDKISVNHISET